MACRSTSPCSLSPLLQGIALTNSFQPGAGMAMSAIMVTGASGSIAMEQSLALRCPKEPKSVAVRAKIMAARHLLRFLAGIRHADRHHRTQHRLNLGAWPGRKGFGDSKGFSGLDTLPSDALKPLSALAA